MRTIVEGAARVLIRVKHATGMCGRTGKKHVQVLCPWCLVKDGLACDASWGLALCRTLLGAAGADQVREKGSGCRRGVLAKGRKDKRLESSV